MNRLFSMLDESSHLVPPIKVDDNYHKFLVIYPAHNNPFVAQWWALNKNYVDLYMYREVYKTRQTLENNLLKVMELSKDDNFFAVVMHPIESDKGSAYRAKELLCSKETKFVPGERDLKRGIFIIEHALAENKLHFSRESLEKEDMSLVGLGYPTSTFQALERATYIENKNTLEFGFLTNGVWATIYAVNFCYSDAPEKATRPEPTLTVPPEAMEENSAEPDNE